MITNKHPNIHRVLTLLCTLSFLSIIVTTYSYFQEKNRLIQVAKKEAKQAARQAAITLETSLLKVQNNSLAIAEDISAGNLDDNQIRNILRESLKKNSTFFEVGAAYLPYSYQPNVRLYAPFFTRKDGKILERQLENIYDYTKDEHEWFHRPLQEGTVWAEPFYDEDTKTFLLECDTPFYQFDPKTKQNKVAGVVFTNYSLGNIKEVMNSLNLGKTGYGFLLTQKGNFAYHPNQQFVEKKFNIFKRAEEQKNSDLMTASKKAVNYRESSMINDRSAITGQDTFLFFEPIGSTGFTLGVVFIQDEILENNQSLEIKIIILLLEFIVFLFLLSILIFKAYLLTPKRLWAVANTTTFLLLLSIITLWTLILRKNYLANNDNNHILVVSQQGAERFLQSNQKINNVQEKTIQIPTGVFIQYMKFVDASEIFIKGYVWQKYKKGIPSDISRGFTFPEAINSNIVEAYRRQQGDYEIVGWYVEANIYQNFDYSFYPLDDKKVGIRLWHKDFDKNIVLVPDFDAYTLISPSTLPGIDRQFFLPGWHLKNSYFQYQLHGYNTNFGIENYVGKENFPELYFTVYLRRKLIKIFIDNFMVPSIIAALLFIILLIFVKKHDEEADFNALEIVSACGGFLFILIIDQISLRQKIVTAGLLYLDYFYFVLYLAILLVAINGLLFVSGKKIPLVQYQNNLITKILYWPSILGALLITTILVFW